MARGLEIFDLGGYTQLWGIASEGWVPKRVVIIGDPKMKLASMVSGTFPECSIFVIDRDPVNQSNFKGAAKVLEKKIEDVHLDYEPDTLSVSHNLLHLLSSQNRDRAIQNMTRFSDVCCASVPWGWSKGVRNSLERSGYDPNVFSIGLLGALGTVFEWERD